MVGIIFRSSGLIIGMTSLILAFIIFRYGFRKIHYMWALFNLTVGTWGFANFFIGIALSKHFALTFWKIGIVSGVFTAILFYHIILILGELQRAKRLIVFYVFGLLFSFLVIFDLAGLDIYYAYNSIFYVRASDMRMVILSGAWGVILFSALYELFCLFIRSSGDKKIQFKYLLIGFMTGFTGATLTMLPWFGFVNQPYPAGNILIWLYLVIATYAILRHKLLDIEVIVRKTLVFAGLLASTFAILILPTLLIQEYVLRSASVSSRMIGLAISGLVIILTMRRIENFLINVTDKYLFQKKYDYKELLKTFTSEVLTVLNLDDLVNLTVNKLTDTVKINSCAVMLFNSDKQRFDIAASNNLKDSSVSLFKSDEIVEYLEHTRGYLLKKELLENKIYVPAKVEEIIDKLNAELIIPMILQDKMIGILSIGKKKSDEDYSQDDLDILLPLARTLAIAISNAELFKELGKTQAEAAQKEKMAVIGTLSAGINHEICNPLGIARGQCEAFLLNIKDGLYKSKTSEELLRKAQEIMTKVIRETDRATAITKKLSSFAKPAKGESELVDIRKEVDEVIGLVGYELKLEKVEIEKNIESNLPRIFVDRKQFQEVLFNLMRNAGQAMGEKGKISVTAKDIGGKVIIDIQDTGSGIPEDKIKELFNPFFTTKDPGKGTGLGLFIVRQVVEKNGGRIYLKKTKVGEGTTFSIEFTAAVPQEVKV